MRFLFYFLGPFVMRTTCRNCHGARVIIKSPCVECQGKGSVVQRRKVTVPVPAGYYILIHLYGHCF